MALPVNFQDDVLASSMNGKRRYNIITNSDGSVSLDDVTEYTQVGSNYGANQINTTNQAVNDINDNTLDSIEEINANTESNKIAGALAVKNISNKLPEAITGFTVGDDGKPYITYKVGADSVTKKLGSGADAFEYGAIPTAGTCYLNNYFKEEHQFAVFRLMNQANGSELVHPTCSAITDTTIVIRQYLSYYQGDANARGWSDWLFIVQITGDNPIINLGVSGKYFDVKYWAF